MMAVNVVSNQIQQRLSVPASDHPGAMIMFRFFQPTLMTGEPLTDGVLGTLAIRPLDGGFDGKVAKLGQINLLMRGGFDPIPMMRMLAKIAHAYAFAKLGPTGFRPFLNDIIIGQPPYYLARFVGSVEAPQPDSQPRHQVSMEEVRRIDGRIFFRVSIRLFADLGMPLHHVIVGERITDLAPYKPTDAHPIARIRLSGKLDADGRIIEATPAHRLDQDAQASKIDVQLKVQLIDRG